MKLDFAFLRSKVGRRILTFFVISAVVPVTAFTILGLLQIADLYRERNESILHQTNRAYGAALSERLIGLETELAAYAFAIRANKASAIDLEQSVATRFHSLARLSGGDAESPGLVGPFKSSQLSEAELAHIDAGKTLLVVHRQDDYPKVLLVRVVDADADSRQLLVGEIRTDYLWSDPNSFVETADVCVLDHQRKVLHCSNATMAGIATYPELIDTRNMWGRFSWGGEETRHVADFISISLGANFFVPSWTIVMSEPEARMRVSLDDFGTVFFQVFILAVLVVALLSVYQIRRSLDPLAKLMDGTRHLAKRDFGYHVQVDSGDEFETLAESFNTMASRLNWQFHVLTTMADIDRRILSTLKLEDILSIVLTRMSDVVPCDLVCMTLVENDEEAGSKGRTYAFTEHGAEPSIIHEFELGPSDIRALLSQTTHVVSAGIRGVPHYLAAPTNLGARLILALPIAIKDSLAALIALGYREKKDFSKTELELARDFADHVAVALSNAAWEERLYLQAHYDTLTGLPNRSLLIDRLQQALVRADRSGGYVAVLFLDLDRFKGVNDSLGHAGGDQLLQETARRLMHAVRVEDTVARLGGDEFVVVIPYLEKDQRPLATITSIAKKLLQAISEPMVIEGLEVFVTGSVGIAFSSDGKDSVDDLLKKADSAMYHAKAQGKANYQFFSQQLNAEAVRRSELEYRLHRAVENEEFELHYQPKVEVSSGRIVGAEALLRWPDPEQGFIAQDEFITLAEETGLIADIGAWVLRTASCQVVNWTELGFPPVSVSVNISPVQFRRSNLIQMLMDALKESGAEPGRLELEITETVAMEDLHRTLATLERIHQLGVSVSIDDFGTGYSSLSFLKEFPVSSLKIDKSFVRNLTVDTRDAAIVTSSIVLAHSLGMSVVAEGVETEEQLAFLSHAQCEYVQGYLFSRPMSARDFAQLLAQRKPYRLASATRARRSTNG